VDCFQGRSEESVAMICAGDLTFLEGIECWLLDMDGTLYLGEELIPGARDFIHKLRDREKKFLFLTNNSSKGVMDYVNKLHQLGFGFVGEEHVFTSGKATILYLHKNFAGKEVYLLGTPALESEFSIEGIKISSEPEVIVVGFDRTLTYAKMIEVCDLVRSGLPYIATHPDLNCPVEGGFIPDIGAIMAFIKASTGRDPDVVVGKPNKPMIEMIADRIGVPTEKMVMVGDRLYTDIAMGQHGLKTILTLSGETKMEDISRSSFSPDLVIDSVKDLLP